MATTKFDPDGDMLFENPAWPSFEASDTTVSTWTPKPKKLSIVPRETLYFVAIQCSHRWRRLADRLNMGATHVLASAHDLIQQGYSTGIACVRNILRIALRMELTVDKFCAALKDVGLKDVVRIHLKTYKTWRPKYTTVHTPATSTTPNIYRVGRYGGARHYNFSKPSSGNLASQALDIVRRHELSDWAWRAHGFRQERYPAYDDDGGYQTDEEQLEYDVGCLFDDGDDAEPADVADDGSEDEEGPSGTLPIDEADYPCWDALNNLGSHPAQQHWGAWRDH